jgi:peptidoglycan/LPS O-acetylase OafA/YrhL
MDEVMQLGAAMPVAGTLAVLAMMAAALVALSPPARTWLADALTLPAPTHGQSFAAIDALRGLAALWVALFHYWQWAKPAFAPLQSMLPMIQSGAKAVPLFVVISGFLIWGVVSRLRQLANLRRYAANRALRILPLLAVVVITSLMLGQTTSNAPGWKILLHDLVAAKSFGSPGHLVPPAWSLFVELNFYMFAPLAAVLIGPGRPLVILGLVVAFYLAELPDDAREFGLWKYFFIGMLTREIVDDTRIRWTERLSLAVFAAGCGLFALDLHVDWASAAFEMLRLAGKPGNAAFTLGLGVASGALVIGAAQSLHVERIGSLAPLRLLGIVSYSIFLWHAVLIAADFPVRFFGPGGVMVVGAVNLPAASAWSLLAIVVPAMCLVGVVSFVAIERPFLRLRRTFAPIPELPAAALRPSPRVGSVI